MLPFQVYKYTNTAKPFRYVVLAHGREQTQDGHVTQWTLVRDLGTLIHLRIETSTHDMFGERDGFKMMDPKRLAKHGVRWEMFADSFAEQIRAARVRVKCATQMQRRFREWKKNTTAALKIQRQLRESVSNPDFAFCRSRLQREFCELSM
jgi:hypothetical protein